MDNDDKGGLASRGYNQEDSCDLNEEQSLSERRDSDGSMDSNQNNYKSTFGSDDGLTDEARHKKDLMEMTAESLAQSGFLRPVQQKITFDGTDTLTSVGIYGNDVTIYPHSVDSSCIDTGSNKVRVSQVAKFEWEQKYSFGNLVACNKKYLAYVVKTIQDCKVRVLNHHSVARVLLTGFLGKVVDLAFDEMDKDLLACSGSFGDVHIYLIQEGGTGLKSSLVQSISQNITQTTSNNCCLAWVPVYGDLVEPIETPLLLASSCGNNCSVLSMNEVFEKDVSTSTEVNSGADGILNIQNCHSKPITKLVVSPDGRVLATSGLDGYVKFWEINFEDTKAPKCLHDWKPHEGEPVTSLFLCDDYTMASPTEDTPSWRFVITGAKYNTEIKIWCSVGWTCLQTIRFDVPAGLYDSSLRIPCIKAALDRSANFFLCTDIHRQVLYVLQLYQNPKEGKAHFTSLSEFLLAHPMLSFAINEVKIGKEKKTLLDSENDFEKNNKENNTDSEEDENDVETDDHLDNDTSSEPSKGERDLIVSLKMFAVHTRALQKLQIKFNPKSSVYVSLPPYSFGTSTDDQLSIQDHMSDISGIDFQGSTISDTDGAAYVCQGYSTEERPAVATSSFHTKGAGSPANSLTNVTSFNTTPSLASNFQNVNMNDGASLEPSGSYGSSLFMEGAEEEEEEEKAREIAYKSIPQQITILKRNDPLPDESASFTHDIASPFQEPVRRVSSKFVSASNSFEGLENSGVLEQRTGVETTSGAPHDISHSSLPSLKDIQIPSVDVTLKSSIPNEMLEARDRDLLANTGHDSQLENTSSSQMLKDRNNMTAENTQFQESKRFDINEQIFELLQQQKSDIKHLTSVYSNLESSIHQLQASLDSLNGDNREHFKQGLQSLHKNVTSNVNKSLKEYSKTNSQMLDQFTKQFQSSAIQKDIAQMMLGPISGKLEKFVKSEMKNVIMPGLQKTLDQISIEVAQKISLIEKTLKDEIPGIVKSEPVVDLIGNSVGKILEATMPMSYKDAFKTMLLPAYEKACKAMFDQINGAFQQGTGQYIQKLEAHLDSRKQRQADAQGPIVKQLNGLVESFQATADRLTESLETNLEALMERQIARSLQNFHSELQTLIKGTVKENMAILMDEYKSEILKSITSCHTATPCTETDYEKSKEMVDKALSEKNIGLAFETALEASDLNIVTYICNTLNPQDVLPEKPVLSQPVIMALVNQLSADLITETDVKISYLENSLVALQLDDDVTSTHLSFVIRGLVENVSRTLEMRTELTGTQKKRLKLLAMSARSLLSMSARSVLSNKAVES